MSENPFRDPDIEAAAGLPTAPPQTARFNSAPAAIPQTTVTPPYAGPARPGHDRQTSAPAPAHADYDENDDDDDDDDDDSTGLFPRPAHPLAGHSRTSVDDIESDSSGFETEEDYDLEFEGTRQRMATQPGILSSMLQLYSQTSQTASQATLTEETEKQFTTNVAPGKSGDRGLKAEELSDSSDDDDAKSFTTHPRWYSHSAMASQASLIDANAKARIPLNASGTKKTIKERGRKVFGKARGALSHLRDRRRGNEMAKITVHIESILQRQKFIIRLCRSLMLYGAPSHRLEDYVGTTARLLAIPCSCIYLPGTMILTFSDPETHTSDVQLVRVATSIDLGKLQHVHTIYKEVLHDVIGVEDATRRLEKIMKKPPARNVWIKVLLYGCASASIGPLFDARIKDLPFCFLLGLIVALMGLVANPKSEAFTNVFEILGALVVSFFARAIGSIRSGGTEVFCFSGIAQGAIAPLLLPGYIILAGALEIQSKKLVAGAVRMFYAIIYSFLLWFGITLGTALYGAIDPSATSQTACTDTNLKEYRFFYVPLFTFFVALANQAQWKQTPAMLVISTVSYTVNFFTNQRFPNTVQVSNALSAFTVGILGNLYSRLVHQAAFNAMVPAILLQVQSGIASQGSLMAGLRVANSIVDPTKKLPSSTSDGLIDGGAGELAYGLVAISIGISFGLFFATVVVYPFGKQRSSLFSF